MAVSTSAFTFTSPSNHVPLHPSQLSLSNGKAPSASSLRIKDTASVQPSKEPFMRLDTLGMKARLLEVLSKPRTGGGPGSGSAGGQGDGEFYLKYLGLFLVGKLRRDEWEGMMGKILDTGLKRQLHNQLLTALLHNASSTAPIASTPTLPLNPIPQALSASYTDPAEYLALQEQLQREDHYEPKMRVKKWVLKIKRDERERIKGMADELGQSEGAGGEGEMSQVVTEMNRGWQGSSRKRTLFQAFDETQLPYCQTTRVLPSPEELQRRLHVAAMQHGLPKGCADEVGEFVSMALESHLDGLIYAAWQMVQANPSIEDPALDTPKVGIDPTEPPTAMFDHRSTSVSSKTGDSNTTSPTNISDDLPSRDRGTTDPSRDGDGDIEMRDVDVEEGRTSALAADGQAGEEGATAAISTTMCNPFPTRTLTLQDMQSLLLQSPNLLPHASSSLYKLQTNIYSAFEAEEILAERLTQERDQRYQAKQAEVIATYQRNFEESNRARAEELMRVREREMMIRTTKRARGKSLALAMGTGSGSGLSGLVVENGGAQKRIKLETESQGATPDSSGANLEDSTGQENSMPPSASTDVDPKRDTVNSPQPNGTSSTNGTPSDLSSRKPAIPAKSVKPPAKHPSAAGNIGIPGVGGIILRPSAKSRLADLGYVGPLDGGASMVNGIGIGMTVDGFGGTGPLSGPVSKRPLNAAAEQLKQDMLYNELIKPAPLPISEQARDKDRDKDKDKEKDRIQDPSIKTDGQIRAAGMAMGLEGDELERYEMGERIERDKVEVERNRGMMISAMRGMPINSGNHWAYVDPAILLRDILG